jgi:hypothetical protein
MVLSIFEGVSIELILVVVFLICVAIFLFLMFKERKTGKVLTEKIDEKDILLLEIDKLGLLEEPPQEIITKIDEAAKNFFEKEMGIAKSMDYSELIKIFQEKNKPHLVDFAETMTKLLYAGIEPTKKTVQNLIYDLEKAAGKEREEKKLMREMQKRQQKTEQPNVPSNVQP